MARVHIRHYGFRVFGAPSLILVVVSLLLWTLWPQGDYSRSIRTLIPEPSVAYVLLEDARPPLLLRPDSIAMPSAMGFSSYGKADFPDVARELERDARVYALKQPSREGAWRHVPGRFEGKAGIEQPTLPGPDHVFRTKPYPASFSVWASPALNDAAFQLPTGCLEKLRAANPEQESFRLELSVEFSEEGHLLNLFVLKSDADQALSRVIRMALTTPERLTHKAAVGRLILSFGRS